MIKGREHLIPELTRCQHRYEQEADHWKQKGWGDVRKYRKCDQLYVRAMQLTAQDAARFALGISDKTEFDPRGIFERFSEYNKLLEAHINHRRNEYDEKTGKWHWVMIEVAEDADLKAIKAAPVLCE
jgi:hypothetical protein